MHDRMVHGEQWAEERTQMRAFMSMDYNHKNLKRQHVPKHN